LSWKALVAQHDWPLDEADFRPVSPAPSDQTNARGGPHREELLRSQDKAPGVANHQQQTVEAAVVVPVPVAGREDDARTAGVNKVGKRGKKKTKGNGLFHDASDLYEPPSIEVRKVDFEAFEMNIFYPFSNYFYFKFVKDYNLLQHAKV
jgi:hypothetical protein